MNCQDKDCFKDHCYQCHKHLDKNHESWFCSDTCKRDYWSTVPANDLSKARIAVAKTLKELRKDI